jgi:hypothetical protein
MPKTLIALAAATSLTCAGWGASAAPRVEAAHVSPLVQPADWYCGPRCEHHRWERSQWERHRWYENHRRNPYYGYGYGRNYSYNPNSGYYNRW